MVSSKLPGLFFFGSSSAKDSNMCSKLVGKLNCQVAQAADAQDADAHTMFVVLDQGTVDGRTSALKRGCLFGWNFLWDRIDIALLGNEVVTQGAVVEVTLTENVTAVAKNILA